MLDILKMLLTIIVFVVFATVLFCSICFICEHCVYHITTRFMPLHIKNDNTEKDLVDELNKLKDEVFELKKTLEPKTTKFTRIKSDNLVKKEVQLDILLRPLNVPNEGRE